MERLLGFQEVELILDYTEYVGVPELILTTGQPLTPKSYAFLKLTTLQSLLPLQNAPLLFSQALATFKRYRKSDTRV